MGSRTKTKAMSAKVFISYSTKDKAMADRIEKELLKNGISVWKDDSAIQVGQNISKMIDRGLSESDFMAVLISQNSIQSGWVDQEWRAIQHKEASEKRNILLPIRLDDTTMPPLLNGRKYADFRKKFDIGFRSLMESIKFNVKENRSTAASRAARAKPISSTTKRSQDNSILRLTEDFLKDVSEVVIRFPNFPPISLIQSLQQMPRSGKKMRFESMKYSLPIRSVYDHLLSVAHSADCIVSESKSIVLNAAERRELALLIAYHDLCEVFLGDLPQYTDVPARKVESSQLYSHQKIAEVNSIQLGLPKKIINRLIWMYLDTKGRASMDTYTRLMNDSNRKNKVVRFFLLLDKLDPLIAIWRYLYVFRRDLHPQNILDSFMDRSRDFFKNPYVEDAVKLYGKDSQFLYLYRFLSDSEKARNYCTEGDLPQESFVEATYPLVSKIFLKRLIEGRACFEFAESNPPTESKPETTGGRPMKRGSSQRKPARPIG